MNFLRYKYIYFSISLILIIPSLISLLIFGLKPSIDFTGGALLELSIIPHEDKKITESSVRENAGEAFELYSIQKTGDESVIIRSQPMSESEKTTIIAELNQLGEVTELRFESVGPTIGKQLLRKTIYAIILASVLILLFVAYRFNQVKYGVCAILAMFHDTLILLGSFSLLGHFYGIEVDALFVTAVLTTLSFSVHDTIIVYDRIRESLKNHPHANYQDLVNLSITETLGRSLNNSLTIIFMLVALLLLGGITVRWFVLALLIGTIAGTYSSTFTAAPLLVVWENIKSRKDDKQK